MNSEQYHLYFKNIKIETLQAIREIIKSGLFREKDLEIKKALILSLNKKLCKIYELKEIPIIYIENYFGNGFFSPSENKIGLNKPSLVTYLHEFAHYKFVSKNELNTEPKARGWSHSAYYLATPNLFKNAVKKGLLIWQSSMEKIK